MSHQFSVARFIIWFCEWCLRYATVFSFVLLLFLVSLGFILLFDLFFIFWRFIVFVFFFLSTLFAIMIVFTLFRDCLFYELSCYRRCGLLDSIFITWIRGRYLDLECFVISERFIGLCRCLCSYNFLRYLNGFVNWWCDIEQNNYWRNSVVYLNVRCS